MRERKDFKRKSGHRDANLFVIATEGEKSEECYFETLTSEEYYANTSVHIEILSSIDGRSSPRDVIKLLDRFKREYKIREDDELWLLIDRDKQSWNIDQIKEVARLCNQKEYHLGLSNPSFEIWILIHFSDLSEYNSAELREIFENKKVNKNRTKLEKEIIRYNGSYNKSNPNLSKVIPKVPQAIKNAKALDQNPNARWINHLGTKVYKLVEKII